jgi:adenine-specific DNA-methyltransferase
MNQKREEVVRFLDKDLLPQVKLAFEAYKPADKALLHEQLEQAIQQANASPCHRVPPTANANRLRMA